MGYGWVTPPFKVGRNVRVTCHRFGARNASETFGLYLRLRRDLDGLRRRSRRAKGTAIPARFLFRSETFGGEFVGQSATSSFATGKLLKRGAKIGDRKIRPALFQKYQFSESTFP